MTGSLLRIGSIIRVDFLIRFRKISTAIIFLALCIAAYMWIPDPASGRALLQINNQRALYNSPALGLSTATLVSILLGLVGYYMVSSSIQMDIRSRTGFVIASTRLKSFEYLLGKFFGNFIFLSVVVAGFLLSCMVMQLIRGEAPLQPLSFVRNYLLIIPPVLVFLSVIAILFESVRFLSGRFGDALYFMLWLFTMGLTAQMASSGPGVNWAAYLDVTGLGFVMQQVKTLTGNDGLAIGSSEYDMSKPAFVFQGLPVPPQWILPRLSSLLFMTPLLLVALFLFHRFDPVRLKASAKKKHRSWLGFFNEKLKFLANWIPTLGKTQKSLSSQSSLLSAIVQDSLLTLQLYPVLIVLLIGFLCISAFSSVSTLQTGILPAIFAVLTIAISDIAGREKRTGLLTTVFAMPRLKSSLVLWKFGSCLLVILVFILIPALKLGVTTSGAMLSLLIGSIFTASVATSLGLLSANPKAFIVLFGMFWYVALNDGGKNPNFDFAGWYGSATTGIQFAYLGIALGILAFTQGVYLYQQKRD